MKTEREQILRLIDEAIEAGARQRRCCQVMGLDVRTVQRWRRSGGGEDRRNGPISEPRNKLCDPERERIVEIAASPEFRDLSPKQIVPRLADRGEYIASESSFYRVLRERDQVKHRSPARTPTENHPREHEADGPGQLWSWDITYLRSPVRGAFYYLHMVEDVWSRKIVGFEVHEEECMELSAALIERIARREGIDPKRLVLHSDNGGPMKGATMRATLDRLGIVPSFSRPRVSDDNAYSESLFRTMKYRPEYPQRAFSSLEEDRTWAAWFVNWYNEEHRHGEIGFVTPEQRHTHRDIALLENRKRVYEDARRRNPDRWTGKTRNWERTEVVRLNCRTRVEPQQLEEAA